MCGSRLSFPFSLFAQFTYTIDQSIPVEVSGKTLLNPWAGGLNAAQVNTMDLNADGQADLVIFDKTASKISTFVALNNDYRYAPEDEILFPSEISTFAVLRDYNCDGKKDLFTFGQIGIFVFQNVTQAGKPLSWKKLSFYNSETSLQSEVLLTKGFYMTNLLPGTNDLPNFIDMDGDGDLDVLNMKFVNPSQAEYHKNFSMELYGTCDSLALVRPTQQWGNFLECRCGKIAFGNQTCAQIGGRIEHTGGKALLTIDMDNDGDNDLYVVSGGYEFLLNDVALQDRLYINNGKGDFTKASNQTLPVMLTSGSKVYPLDYDKDGKQDLLVLGRQVPGQYPSPADTYLLHNIGTVDKVKFEISKRQPKEFKNLGMATSAVVTDYNNDTYPDLIIVGEWMPIRVFENKKTGFKEVSQNVGLSADTTGWWWSIQQGDFDNDGDMDYIVGNNGLNYKYQASPDATFDIFVNDFDNDKHKDIVLSYYNDGKQYPVRARGCSSQQIPNIKKKFKNYESFSEATLVDVYTEKSLNEALHYKVKSFASIYLENKKGKFCKYQLPVEAQFSCINQIAIDDYDKDGNLDVLISGNMFNSEVETPRNDAGHGLFLKGNGKGKFKSIPATQSGFYTSGDVKNMVKIKVKGVDYFLVTKNNSYLQSIKIN